MASARVRNPRGEGERLRTELLDAATELLAETGDADKVSVRAITGRAGVTANALYLHFADKQQLVAAVRARGFAELRSYVAEAKSRHSGDPWAQLRAGCRGYVRFALERPGQYRALFGTFIASQDAQGPHPGLEAFDDLVQGVARCLAPERDAFRIATMVWIGMHGRVSLQAVLGGFPFMPIDAYIDELIAAHVGAPPG